MLDTLLHTVGPQTPSVPVPALKQLTGTKQADQSFGSHRGREQKRREGRTHLTWDAWAGYLQHWYSRSWRDEQAGPQQAVGVWGGVRRGTQDAEGDVEACVCGDSPHLHDKVGRRGQME